MTTFVDGPAKGKNLSLKRAPRFLRVVCEGSTWDALDQPDDTPKETEKLFAYEIVGEPYRVHLHCSGGRGGFYQCGSYKSVK